MDRYRTSIQSQSHVNRSHLSHDHVRSNLESRIEYENSQVSLISLLKVLAIITTIILLTIATKLALDARTPIEGCGRKTSFGNYLARVRYRVFGGVNPDDCEKKVETIQDHIDGSKVEVITKTTTCKTTDKSQTTDDGGIWSYFGLPFFGCEEYKAHEAALKNQKFSVSEGLDKFPSLTEMSKTQSTSETVNLDNLKDYPEANINDIKNKFDSMLGGYTIQVREIGVEKIPAAVEAPENMEKINEAKKLLDKRNVFNLQLKVNDLVHSVKNLNNKKKSLYNFQERFFNATKSPTACNAEMAELRQKLSLANEKVQGSIARRQTWEADIVRLTDRIKEKMSESKNSGPIKQIESLKDEIEQLVKKKGQAQASRVEIERRVSQVNNHQSMIRDLNDKISSATNDLNGIRNRIADYKRQIDSLNNSNKLSDSRLYLLRMKLEIYQRNKHIKEFLMSLINTKEGKNKDLHALFADKISSEKELKLILRNLINDSRTSSKEVLLTEDELDTIIKQDETDLNQISKLYNELIKIINEYKDIDFDISTMSVQITELEAKKIKGANEIAGISATISSLENQATAKDKEIEGLRKKIAECQDRIRTNEDYIATHTIDIPDIERSIAAKTKLSDDLKSQWEVT